MCFSFNLGTKQPIASIFFTAAQLNTDIQISGLISIFIKCEPIYRLLRAACLKLEINEIRCYEEKIEENEKAGSC